MEQITSAETSSEQLGDSPRSKRTEHQLKDESVTTSSDATITAVKLYGSSPIIQQRLTCAQFSETQQSSKNGRGNFVLPSEEDSVGSPRENLDPNSAGLKSSQAGGVWKKYREEARSAQVKEK